MNNKKIMDNIVIIKYNAGNIRSVLFALERLGYTGTVTDDPGKIRRASHVIYPMPGCVSPRNRTHTNKHE